MWQMPLLLKRFNFRLKLLWIDLFIPVLAVIKVPSFLQETNCKFQANFRGKLIYQVTMTIFFRTVLNVTFQRWELTQILTITGNSSTPIPTPSPSLAAILIPSLTFYTNRTEFPVNHGWIQFFRGQTDSIGIQFGNTTLSVLRLTGMIYLVKWQKYTDFTGILFALYRIYGFRKVRPYGILKTGTNSKLVILISWGLPVSVSDRNLFLCFLG